MISSSSIVKALTQKKSQSQISPEKLLAFLSKNHLSGLLPTILKRLGKHAEKEKRENTVFITTSHEFSQDVMKSIEKRVGSLGGRDIKNIIDPKIIGGFKIKDGYKIVDGSVSNNIKILKESLSK